MAEINSRGYESLRRNIDVNANRETFDVIELTNNGSGVIRLSTSDSRVTINSSVGANPYEIQIVVSPSDGDITSGQSFDGVRLYFEDVDGSEVTPIESFSERTLNSSEDELTVRHQVECPQL